MDPGEFNEYFAPEGFRTTFKTLSPDEDIPRAVVRTQTLAGANHDIVSVPIPETNMEIGVSVDSAIYRLNDGKINDQGRSIGYEVRHVTQLGYQVPNKPGMMQRRRVDVTNQFVLPEETTDVAKWRPGDLTVHDKIRLVSRKPTDSVFVRMSQIPDGLRLDQIGREFHSTPIRAAAISAAQLLIMRASIELDLAPEEFETLEPRVRIGMPMLQIADSLVNGSGFSRCIGKLYDDGSTLASKLILSMVADTQNDKLIASFIDEDHRRKCRQACYLCMQRYGNRGYHGLLDWRLGLGYLRSFIEPNYRSGLDGKWDECVELFDWPSVAVEAADELSRLQPSHMTVRRVGTLGLPLIERRGSRNTDRFLVVHPFWLIDRGTISEEPLRSSIQNAGGPVRFIDTFNASRRPQATLDNAVSL
jgi:hypothetical protein